MPAANTDKLRKKKSLFQTTLNGGISDSDTSLTLNSASGLPTDTGGTIVVNRVDANGTATPSSMEVMTGVVSGSTITNLLRAKDSTTAKSHANASVVEMVWDAATWNDFVDAYLGEHGQDGKHLPAALSVPTHAATSKATPVDADELPIVDSAASNVLKKLTWSNLKATLKAYLDTLYKTIGDKIYSDFNGPEGTLINGKIDVSVSSNNTTLALNTKEGNNPSASDPVYVMLGGELRTVNSELSVTANAGTNWFNSGGAELATKEVDYFAYLIWDSTGSAVRIGFARIPFGRTMGDFNTSSSTNEKYRWYNQLSANVSTDPCVNIGRFAATLSAGAGYTWSVPTFTATNLVQEPIFETRNSNANFTVDGAGSLGTFTRNVFSSRYKIVGDEMHVQFYADITNKGSWSGAFQVNFPFSAAGLYTLFGIVSAQNGAANYLNSNCYGPIQINTNSLAQFEKGIGNSLVQWSDLTASF